MGMLFMQAKRYLSKLTASHFGTLNTNKPECAGKNSHYHAQQEQGQLQRELQDMCRGTHSTSVQAVCINRHVRMEISQS